MLVVADLVIRFPALYEIGEFIIVFIIASRSR
jgi:hypothetical protein